MKSKATAAILAIPRPLALSLALAFPLLPGLAHAVPTVTASGSYNDEATGSWGETAKSGSFDQPATGAAFSAGATGATDWYWDTSTFLRATSSGDGHFGAASINKKSYGSTAAMTSDVHLVFADSIHNTTGSAQDVNFGIAISQLQIDVSNGSFQDFDPRTNIASFSANVYAGASNTLIWSSSFAWNGGILSASGTDLGMGAAYSALCAAQHSPWSVCTSSFYSGGFGIGGYSTELALGSLGANESLDVRYTVDLHTETNTYGGVASISFNDPSNLSSGMPAAHLGFSNPVAAVPEPETYLMMAAGLGVIGVTRRRRRAR